MSLPRQAVIGCRIALALCIVLICYLATSPDEDPISANLSDKASHLLAFFTLTLLADFAFPHSRLGWEKILPLLGFGLGIELVQYFLPYRTFSLLDLMTDGVGIALYALSLPMLMKLPLLAQRWR